MKYLTKEKIQGILLAGITYTPLEPFPNATTATYNSLGLYLNFVFKILLSLGAMVAVVTLVFGGIAYMVSEIADKKTEARKRIQAALLGLFLLLTCWLILYEINPNLVKFCLPGLDAACQGAMAPSTARPAAQPSTASVAPKPDNADKADCESVAGRTLHATGPGTWECR